MTDTTDDIAEEISFQSFEDDCKLLGNLLNDVLQREVGGKFMEKFERNRILAQSACNMRLAGIEDTAELLEKQLAKEISDMTLEEALTLARAFSHYLNLMGIAETHHRVRKTKNAAHLSKSCDDIFNRLLQGGVPPEELYNTVCKQEVEIVLTAHPTQINRRTLQYKHIRIAMGWGSILNESQAKLFISRIRGEIRVQFRHVPGDLCFVCNLMKQSILRSTTKFQFLGCD